MKVFYLKYDRRKFTWVKEITHTMGEKNFHIVVYKDYPIDIKDLNKDNIEKYLYKFEKFSEYDLDVSTYYSGTYDEFEKDYIKISIKE